MCRYLLLRRIVACLLLSNSLIACSYSSLLDIGPEEHEATLAKPIRLSLSQGYIAGTTLHLRIEVESLHDLATNSVVIQVKGLKNGVVKEVQSIPLNTVLTNPNFPYGKTLVLPFTLSIENLDRFTISCSWGNEGSRLLSELKLEGTEVEEKIIDIKEPQQLRSKGPAVFISNLNIHKVIGSCHNSNCSVRLNLEGKIKKSTEFKLVNDISLAYRLVWVPDGQIPETDYDSKELLSDEKLLSFGKDAIPEEGFDFSIRGEKDLPEIPGGKFMPVVRILNYKALK